MTQPTRDEILGCIALHWGRISVAFNADDKHAAEDVRRSLDSLHTILLEFSPDELEAALESYYERVRL